MKLSKYLRQILYKLKQASLLKNKTQLEFLTALENIKGLWYKECPSFTQNNKIDYKYDLEIIIAAYNVRPYIDECMKSAINQQTNYNYCITVVNDGSTDDTGTILQKYQGYDNVNIIDQENRGFSGARNRALENISGKYVMFFDSDDTLPEDAVENMMKVAVKKDADIVAGGYTRFNDKGTLFTSKLSDSVKSVSANDIPGFTCMKVIRSDLLNNFCFPEKFLFEDTVISKLIYPQCKKAYVIPDIVYNYRVRNDSISSSFDTDKECIDTFWITKYCLEEHIKHGYPLDESVYTDYLKQCYVNYLRTRYLPQEVQESLFVLTADMLAEHWGGMHITTSGKFKMLDRALKKKSFTAYIYTLQRWDLL